MPDSPIINRQGDTYTVHYQRETSILEHQIISMRNLNSLGLRVHDNQLWILDQQMLPHEELWIQVTSPKHMIEIIQALKVRGAPMIAIAACLCLATFSESQDISSAEVLESANQLKQARPTAVNLAICLERMLAAAGPELNRSQLSKTAIEIFEEDIALCDRIANNGLELLSAHEGILTICNTGRIATAGKGTALGIIYRAHELGLSPHVYITETRPLLQGGRLTAWELQKNKVACTLLCDNAAAALFAQGKIAKVLVGADRIARNGDTANKIGTYSLAIMAKHHGVPFYVAAPFTTLDPHCASGAEMTIEQRSPAEVRGVKGSFGKVEWSPADVAVFNPAFDVTPAELITGIVLDSGYFDRSQIRSGALMQTALHS